MSNIFKTFTVSDELDILVGQASDAVTSERITALCASVTVSASAGTTKEVVAKLQASADGVAWFDISGKTVTITGDTTGGFADTAVCYPYVRLAYTKNAATTAATIDAKIWAKILS